MNTPRPNENDGFALLASALQALPECAPGHLRLYRIEPLLPSDKNPHAAWVEQARTELGLTAAQGRWFTRDPLALAFYAADLPPHITPVLVHADARLDEASAWSVATTPEQVAGRSPRAFSRDEANEFFVPAVWASQASRVVLSSPAVAPVVRNRPRC